MNRRSFITRCLAAVPIFGAGIGVATQEKEKSFRDKAMNQGVYALDPDYKFIDEQLMYIDNDGFPVKVIEGPPMVFMHSDGSMEIVE